MASIDESDTIIQTVIFQLSYCSFLFYSEHGRTKKYDNEVSNKNTSALTKDVVNLARHFIQSFVIFSVYFALFCVDGNFDEIPQLKIWGKIWIFSFRINWIHFILSRRMCCNVYIVEITNKKKKPFVYVIQANIIFFFYELSGKYGKLFYGCKKQEIKRTFFLLFTVWELLDLSGLLVFLHALAILLLKAI